MFAKQTEEGIHTKGWPGLMVGSHCELLEEGLLLRFTLLERRSLRGRFIMTFFITDDKFEFHLLIFTKDYFINDTASIPDRVVCTTTSCLMSFTTTVFFFLSINNKKTF